MESNDKNDPLNGPGASRAPVDTDYRDMLEDMRQERESARALAERKRLDEVAAIKDRRQFWRSAMFAGLLAILFNNPAAWIKATWAWLQNHVTIH